MGFLKIGGGGGGEGGQANPLWVRQCRMSLFHDLQDIHASQHIVMITGRDAVNLFKQLEILNYQMTFIIIVQ